MKKTSKRFSEIKSKTQDVKLNLDEAVKLLKECANAKFDEAIEFHIKTNDFCTFCDFFFPKSTDTTFLY